MFDGSQDKLTLPASPAAFRGNRPPKWRDAVRVMIRSARSRHQLRDMEPRILDDIGITRAEALAEAGRAPWRTDVQIRAGFCWPGIGFGHRLVVWCLSGGGMFARRPLVGSRSPRHP